MHRKHFSDALLMARLDGELSYIRLRVVEGHLRRCWMCRARSAEIEAQAEAVAQAYEGAVFPVPRQIEDAKAEFLRLVERVEASGAFAPATRRISVPWPRWKPALATMLLVSLGILGLFAYRSNFERRANRIAARSPQTKPARVSNLPPSLADSVFEPHTAPVRKVNRGREPEAVSVSPAPDARWLDEAEIEVRYLLHRHGACRGGAIEVSQAGGHVVVEGIVDTEQRKQELLAALNPTALAGGLSLNIRTVSEAVPSEDTSDAPGRPPASRLLIGRAPSKLLAEIELEKYFREHPESRVEASRIASVANHALSLSSAVMDDAWALRRLATRYGHKPAPSLSPRAQGLLMWMVRDHTEWMREGANQISAQLDPLVAPLAPRLGAVPAESAAADLDEDWPAACESLFEAAQRLHALTQQLFAGGGMYAENGQMLAQPPAGDRAAARLEDLPDAFSALRADANLLLAHLNRQLTAGAPPRESDHK